MKKRFLQLISIGAVMAVTCVLANRQAPMVSHALDRNGAVRMTNYAPLYLDPVEEDSSTTGTSGTTGDNAAGGTTVIDPNAQQGSNAASQENSGTTDSNAATSQNTAGTQSSNASQEQTAGSTSTAGDSASQESTAGAGTATSAGNAGSSSSAGVASSAATVPVTPNPYTASVNTRDMPATGVEDLRRGVVALILVLFGIVTILISIPTLKGKRRGER